MDSYFFDTTDWGEDIVVSIDEGRSYQEISYLPDFPKEILFSNIDIHGQPLFSLTLKQSGVDYFLFPELEVTVGVVG